MSNDEITRRDFVSMTVAAGIAAAGGSQTSAQQRIVETNVDIKTADGVCDAAFMHPAAGAAPGVIVWADALGTRPALRDIARRLAADGYSVLLPNPFYRVVKGVQIEDASKFNFGDPAQRAKLGPWTGSIMAAGAVERDAAALVAWLDAQPQVDRTKRIGVQGYCMGGPLTVRTSAAVPNRIGAGASFHGGQLVTEAPDSPHLLAPKIRAKMYFGIAVNDDKQQPDQKTKLKEAFDAAKNPAEIEVYTQAQHGWCVPDIGVYSKADADRAWARLLALYKTALA